jgi:Tol biopolymer transport system component
LLYQREQSLMAQPFDASGLKITGDAFPIAEQVANPLNYRLGYFSSSQNGVLVYLTGVATRTQLMWMDANGKQLTAVGEPGPNSRFRLSPDGSRLAKELFDEAHRSVDLWLVDLARGVQTRFTFDPAADTYPVWSPDATRIVFASNRKGHTDLYAKNASGAGTQEPLVESDVSKTPTDWSHGGRFLAYDYFDPNGKTKSDIWVLPLFGERKPFPFLQTEFNEADAVFSPDGHWIAYQSDESGSFEVYVAPFLAAGGPEGSASVSSGPQGGKWQVSQGGGRIPTWRRDGNGLYFLGSEGKLMEAAVTPKGAAVEIGIQREVLQAHFAQFGSYARTYDIAPDGKRFLVLTSEDASGTPLTLVTNWTAGLKK